MGRTFHSKSAIAMKLFDMLNHNKKKGNEKVVYQNRILCVVHDGSLSASKLTKDKINSLLAVTDVVLKSAIALKLNILLFFI